MTNALRSPDAVYNNGAHDGLMWTHRASLTTYAR